MDIGQAPEISELSVVVDDREATSGILPILEATDGIRVTVRRLSLGDYRIDGRILFERKTLTDLTVSIQDGRLFRQGIRLAKSPLWTAIILEGTARDLAGNGMRREAIQGALITLTLYLGVPMLRARDREESVRLMCYAARQGQNVVQSSNPHRKAHRAHDKDRLQSHVLQGLPGIGPERASALLARFGTIESVMTAGTEELAGVPGIGMHTAESIRRVVG